MSDDAPRTPPEDQPAGWAPFGREPEPAGPLWSADDPAAYAPPQPPALGGDAPGDPPAGSATPPEGPAPPPPLPPPSPPPAPPGRGAWPPPVTTRQSGTATASLVLGVLGLFAFPVICSVAAVVLGVKARREIAARPARLTGRGVATAGLALGVIGLLVWLVFVLVGTVNYVVG